MTKKDNPAENVIEFDVSDNEVCNPSENRPFSDVLAKKMSRRNVMSGSLAVAATGFMTTSGVSEAFAYPGFNNLVDFTPVSVADGNGPMPTISEDYEYQVLIPWGEPIVPEGPSYQYPPSAENQANQIGIGHDGMSYFPMGPRGREFDQNDFSFVFGRGNRHGMLVVNHEFGGNTHVLGKAFPESLDDVRASQHAHGVSVVEIKRRSGTWETVSSNNARRIHVNTPVQFSGPAANSELLKNLANNAPQGTVNNCGNGQTPWGTYLTCEENFNGYFGTNNESWIATEEQNRYGISSTGFGYGWHVFDERFDMANANYINEINRFGWIVEIDPYDATKKATKQTALGRFKHEGAAVTEGKDGKAVVYMGDDQRFDYIYRFVSKESWRAMRASGRSPLEEGDLYVARFNDDGTGTWLKLSIDNPILAERFNDQAEILVYARIAADLLGATPMDRPEWTTVAPNGDVYCTLTNNSQRSEPNAANPLAPNSDGHIIRWRDTEFFTGEDFTWDIFVFAQDTHGTEESFSDPDGLWADPFGRLFIQTDGGQKDGLNNQMVVCDIEKKEFKRLITGVTGDEITGIAVTPDQRTMFINVQHPGNGDPSLTNFPALPDGQTIPRDCTLVITHKKGKVIGS
ncbi:MAG: PhoX family phosphatase [Pseudomonadota bacterium]